MVSDNEWAEEENKGDSSFWRRKDKMAELQTLARERM